MTVLEREAVDSEGGVTQHSARELRRIDSGASGLGNLRALFDSVPGHCAHRVDLRKLLARQSLGLCPSKSSVDLAGVATCSYIRLMISTGIRELKNNLSHYVRQIEAGKRIAVTAHGRVVAELVPPATATRPKSSRYDELIAAGIIEPAAKPYAPPPEWPDIRLPTGTAAELIDSDRGEP